jgi:hypothetical protein
VVHFGNGISFYNNTVTVISDGCGSQCSQHTDFFQMAHGHLKVYNNTFNGSADQAVFYSGYGVVDTITSVLIYNNVFETSGIPGTVYDLFGFAIFHKPDRVNVIHVDMVDVIIVNNTIVDFTAKGGRILHMTGAASYTNCHFKNNLMKNSSANLGITANAAVSISNNSSQSSAVQFVAYTQYAAHTNDLHLAAEDAVAMDTGADLSSLIPALDKDGLTRPVGSGWHIGAYEYGTIR